MVGVPYVLRKPEPNLENENSCTTTWFQVGQETDYSLYAINLLVSRILKEKCYATLRTKEQLGTTATDPLTPTTQSLLLHQDTLSGVEAEDSLISKDLESWYERSSPFLRHVYKLMKQVQSSVKDPAFLEHRISEFVETGKVSC